MAKMSDSEMIEYEINDDLIESMDRNLGEVQIKNKNDVNLQLQYTMNADIEISNPGKFSFKNEKQLLNKNPQPLTDSNINKILQGKTAQNSSLRNSATAKNADLKQKNNHVNSLSNKKSNLNYSSSARNYKNFSTGKNNLIGKNELKESALKNNNYINNTFKDPVLSEFQRNNNLLSHHNNFNTIGNFETEGFLSTKNKYANTFKLFGNTNNTNNTINTSAMKNEKKSIDVEKTKTITNNKTDYKTINSNLVNNSKNILNPANEKNSKFEVRLKDHFNTLKNQKAVSVNPATYKETITKKPINKPAVIAKENKNPRNSNTNKINQHKNSNIDYNNNNNANSTTNKNKVYSYLNLKFNLDPSSNSNVNENDLNYDDNCSNEFPQTSKNDANIKFLLSDQFKSSLDSSIRNTNKSFNSNLSKMNKSAAKKSLISFDLSKQLDNQRSLSIGERLYRKSIAYKNLKEKRVSIELSKKNMETIGDCSFKPKICEDSIMLNVKVF